MTNTAPAQVFSAREAIRVALADLALAYDRKETRGVSGAEMARACGVSPQSFGRYLSGERVFPLDHLPLLPPTAYRAALAAIEACRATPSAARPVDSRGRRLSTLVGEHQALLERVLADNRVDEAESAQLRVVHARRLRGARGIRGPLARERAVKRLPVLPGLIVCAPLSARLTDRGCLSVQQRERPPFGCRGCATGAALALRAGVVPVPAPGVLPRTAPAPRPVEPTPAPRALRTQPASPEVLDAAVAAVPRLVARYGTRAAVCRALGMSRSAIHDITVRGHAGEWLCRRLIEADNASSAQRAA